MGQPLPSPDALAPLLEAERLGVLTDFDGTIAAIAVRPEGAFASPVAREALARLARHLPLVGAISGRALIDLRAKIDLPELLYIGSHGLTWWYQGFDELPAEALPYVEKTDVAKVELMPLLALEGVRFEEKGAGMAIHYRLASDHAATRAAIIEAVSASPAAREFELREGIFVLELFPRVKVNKGTALRRVVERFELDGILFLGDELTDVDAMYAAAEMKGSQCQTASIAVRHAESPALTAETADWVVDGVAGAELVLEWLAGEVERRSGVELTPSPGPSPTA